LLEDRGNERLDGLQKRLENLSIIGTVDIKMLNTPLSNTSENIVLKCYFLRSIAIAKRKGDKRIKITFHEVYCHLGIPEVSDKGSQGALRVKYYDTRDKVIKCLDFWKKSNLIKNYSNNTKAITIIL